MKSKEEIAKLVCGENYSLDMLIEKGFYLSGDIIQIDSRNCISRGEIDKIFQPEKIILDFCKKRNIIIDTSEPKQKGAAGYAIEGDLIEQTKKVLGIMQSSVFLYKEYYNAFMYMKPYTQNMVEKFGYSTKNWNNPYKSVIVGENVANESDYNRLTKEERELFKGYLTQKEAFELSTVMKFYLCISMIAAYKEEMHKDYIIMYKNSIYLNHRSLQAIKKLGADITECLDTYGNQVLFIDLRNFRADKESILDKNLIKEFLPEVIDSQEVEQKDEKNPKKRKKIIRNKVIQKIDETERTDR